MTIQHLAWGSPRVSIQNCLDQDASSLPNTVSKATTITEVTPIISHTAFALWNCCKCENFTYEGFYIAISYLQTYFINKWSPLEVQLENHFKNKQQQQRLNWKVSCFKRKKPPTEKTLKASVTHFSIQRDGCKGRLYYSVLWVKFSSFASLLFKSFWN